MKPKKIITIQYSVLAILSFIVFFLPFIKYEEEGEAIIDNINAFPATEREELSALTDAQKNMMRQPFLGPYLFNWNNNTREALELLEQNQPLQRVLTLLSPPAEI